MRIDPNLIVAPITSEETTAKPRQKRTTRPPGASVVALSAAGAAVVADADEPEMSRRVESLRMMVEAGTYTVDLNALASRIVDDDAIRGSR